MNPLRKLQRSIDAVIAAESMKGGRLLIVPICLLLLLVLVTPSVSIEASEGYWHEVRSIYMSDLGLGQLEGLAYHPADNVFHLATADQSGRSRGTMAIMNMSEDVLGTYAASPRMADPLNMALNPASGELLFLNPSGAEFLERHDDSTAASPSGARPVAVLGALALGIGNPQGMAVDAGNNRAFILDSSGPSVVEVDLSVLDNATLLDGLIAKQRRPLRLGADAGAVRGIAYDPTSDHLYVSVPAAGRIYETSLAGEVVSVLDVSELGLRDPQSMVMAPSADSTDDPAIMSLFVVDTGRDAAKPIAGGRLVEIYLKAPELLAINAVTLDESTFRTTETSAWSNPSPDPAGVDFHPGLGRLIISDSEVEEMTIFQGVNVFVARTNGSLTATCSTMAYSVEPVGAAVNPATGSIFFSDDNSDYVYEVDLGADGQYCTADDTVTQSDVYLFGSDDAEGLAYGDGKLFVSDGVNAEVYVVSPGANGVFDGIAPDGDDVLVTQFDTASLGIRDPEGIAYHAGRNSLFLVSRLDRRDLVEVATDGTPLNVFDITALNAVLPGGAGVGPSSIGSNGTSVYIVDRGVDNNQDPNENDGKLYEVPLGDNVPDPPTSAAFYLSRDKDSTRKAGDVLGTKDEDILYFDGSDYHMYFDGSDVGVSKLDLVAFHIVDDDTILMSFHRRYNIPGVGLVDDSDIVQFDATSLGPDTAGSFSLYFDGSDVELTTGTERVGALSVLPDGSLVIGTNGNYNAGGLSGQKGDLLRFTPTSLGADTAGTWELYFDGSDVGISNKIMLDAVSVGPGGDFYLSSITNFRPGTPPGIIRDEDVFLCPNATTGPDTSCTISADLFFDGSEWGLKRDDVDAIHVP